MFGLSEENQELVLISWLGFSSTSLGLQLWQKRSSPSSGRTLRAHKKFNVFWYVKLGKEPEFGKGQVSAKLML